MRYAQLVVGPAGSGKSTYCSVISEHASNINRTINVVNLDPAAEYFDYNPLVDIRDLIQVDDAMDDEDLHFGPNGGLIFCMEYLLKKSEWLKEELGDMDDDYILFDCPGQIELYTHMNIMKELVTLLERWGFRVCVVFLMDAQFMVDGAKFISGEKNIVGSIWCEQMGFVLESVQWRCISYVSIGAMAALSVMINLELPHLNVISKMDQLKKFQKTQLDGFLEPDPHYLLGSLETRSVWSEKYRTLSEAIGQILVDYSLVRFHTLNVKNEENIGDLLLIIDNILQFGEDADVKTHDFEYPDNDEIGDD